jgi:phosphonate metabolism protein PhnN/1,5-bisphosphokinase (PRPP-forming)
MTGRLFVILGPSGVGKDTLIGGAVAADPSLHWARRVITRPEEAGGEPFEGVTEDEFARRLAAGAFALHWQAHGLHYGLPHAELAPLASGRDVVFNGSRAALDGAQATFPDLGLILVTAPPELLAARLAARGREPADDIARRLSRAAFTLPAGLTATEIANDATPAEGIARLLGALGRLPAPPNSIISTDRPRASVPE